MYICVYKYIQVKLNWSIYPSITWRLVHKLVGIKNSSTFYSINDIIFLISTIISSKWSCCWESKLDVPLGLVGSSVLVDYLRSQKQQDFFFSPSLVETPPNTHALFKSTHNTVSPQFLVKSSQSTLLPKTLLDSFTQAVRQQTIGRQRASGFVVFQICCADVDDHFILLCWPDSPQTNSRAFQNWLVVL